MKRLLYIWFMFLLVAALGGGCSRGGGEAGLVAIDSLIAASPDSALAALGRIDTAALGEGDRAYHALLTYRALKTCGIAVTDDSLTKRAWRWYAHHGPYELRICAMRYLATNAQDMGNDNEAMRWYKRVELMAQDNKDLFNIGYAQMSMAVIYQHHNEPRLSIDKYRLAESNLKGQDDECVFYCQQQLAQLYMSENEENDSADFYVELALKAHPDDTLNLSIDMSNRAARFFYAKKYSKSKQAALETIDLLGDQASTKCWQLASQSFALLKMTDSAEYYLVHSPQARTAFDSAAVYHSMSLLSQLKGDWKHAHYYEIISDSITEHALLNARSSQLVGLEKDVEKEKTKQLLDDEKHKSIFLQLLLAIAFLSSAYFLIGLLVSIISFKQIRRELMNLQGMFNDLEAELTQVSSQHNATIQKAKKAESALADNQREVKQLRESLDEAKRRTADAESAKATSEETAEKLRESLDEAKRRTADAESAKDTSEKAAEKLRESLDEAKRRTADAESTLIERQQEVERLRQEQAEAKERTAQAERALTEQRQEVRRLLEEQDEAIERTAQAENELVKRQQEVMRLRTACADQQLVSTLYAKLKVTYDQVVDSFGKIAEIFYVKGNNPESFRKQFENIFDETWKNDNVWEQIDLHINQTRNNALKNFYLKHPILSERQKHLLVLAIIGFSRTAIAICLHYSSPNNVSVMINKLKSKLGISCDLVDYVNSFADAT